MRQRALSGRGYLASNVICSPLISGATNPWEEAGTLSTLEGARDKLNLRGLSELWLTE
jgi:hypothetical protein